MDTSKLVEIIKTAKKPVGMWEHNPTKNNGFFHYHLNPDTLTLDTPPTELSRRSLKFASHLIIPEEVKRLFLLARDVSTKAYEANQGYRSRMNPLLITINRWEGSINRYIVYVAGGILFRDEETLSKLHHYFNLKCIEVLDCSDRPDHGGMVHLLGLKELDSAVQFASHGAEWETSPGYAHLCLGHVPYRKRDYNSQRVRQL